MTYNDGPAPKRIKNVLESLQQPNDGNWSKSAPPPPDKKRGTKRRLMIRRISPPQKRVRIVTTTKGCLMIDLTPPPHTHTKKTTSEDWSNKPFARTHQNRYHNQMTLSKPN